MTFGCEVTKAPKDTDDEDRAASTRVHPAAKAANVSGTRSASAGGTQGCVMSEGFEPREECFVAAPSRISGLGDVRQKLEGASLGLHIGLCVVVRGIWARVAQPSLDHRRVDTRGHQMDGARVAKCVGRHVLRV